MYKTITEGKANIRVPTEKKVSSELPVFYNPVMKLNRDLTVSVLANSGLHDVRVCLPLAGTGVRGIRLLLETNIVNEIVMNDFSKEAVKIIKQNLKLNKLDKDKRIKIENRYANALLDENEGFQYIDVDPFGYPGSFLDSAINKIGRNGIIGVTATDTSCLCGSYQGACQRKYWARSLRNIIMHETGLRILIRFVQLIGAKYDKALIPIFSYSSDHYMRVFFRCEKKLNALDKILSQHCYLTYCGKCFEWKVEKHIFAKQKCKCGHKNDYAGPLWSGKLWDKKLVKKMAKNSDLKVLQTIKEEMDVDVIGFYPISKVAERFKIHNIEKIDTIIEKIKKKGHKATRTHFIGEGVRTDIPVKRLVKLMG